MENGSLNPSTRADCVRLSIQVLACLDQLSQTMPADQAQVLQVAAAHLQTAIELLAERST